jgi:tripartite-type tricarboxylate transporter receptor subunit TctC
MAATGEAGVFVYLCRVAVAGAVALTLCPQSQAQDWPQRPLKIMVIAAPGGLPDLMARLVARQLTESLGQPVVVENRPGAGGNMAALAVAKAAPDGYTLLLTGNNHAVNPTLIPDAGFDYERDLAPVTMVAEANMLLVAHPSLGVGNVRELIAFATAKPNAVSAAISPIGTPNHLGVELLAQKARLDLTFVPYPGIGPAMPDLLAGRTHIAISATSSMLPHVRSGALKALAVTRPVRAPIAPDVPTVAESGIPGFDLNAWICLMTTGGAPAPVIARFNAEVRKAMASEEVRASFERQGLEASTMSPQQLGAYIKSESEKWANVLKNAKVRKQ